MITIVEGDLLQAKEDILVHQVNCLSKFGAGLALQIRKKYPETYKGYLDHCNKEEHKHNLLGTVKFVRCKDGKYIANVFGQYGYGRGEQQTIYEELSKGLYRVRFVAEQMKMSVAIPYGIGCGLAGGNIEIVNKIIDAVFADYPVTLYKWKG